MTPLKASIIDCTDVSPCFNPVGIEGMEVRCSALCLIWKIIFFWSKFQFYADLHQLSKAHSQAASLLKHTQMDPLLRNNIKQILEATRPLSFC